MKKTKQNKIPPWVYKGQTPSSQGWRERLALIKVIMLTQCIQLLVIPPILIEHLTDARHWRTRANSTCPHPATVSWKRATRLCHSKKWTCDFPHGPEVKTKQPVQGPWVQSMAGKVPQATESHQDKTKVDRPSALMAHSRGTSTSQEGSERFPARKRH